MAVILPIDLLVVYFTAYFLVPKYLLKQRLLEFGVYFSISVFIFLVMEQAAYYYIVNPEIYKMPRMTPFWYFPSFFNIFLGTYSFVFLFSGVRLFRGWLKDKQHQLELEQQNLQSELRLLRSQINPHFIFNTLNNIDSLIYSDQDRASDAIVGLSEIMRYMLYESNTEWVALEKEVYFLESMIELIRLRLKDPDYIQFNFDGDASGLMIPPMLLVPFVENAYKHGRKQGESPGIIINLNITDTAYQFEVINQYDPNYTGEKDSLGGIGLANVERRLELIFPGEHDFYINNAPPNFQIYIEVPARTLQLEAPIGETISSALPHPLSQLSPSPSRGWTP